MDKCNLYIFLRLLSVDLRDLHPIDSKRSGQIAYSLDDLGLVIL